MNTITVTTPATGSDAPPPTTPVADRPAWLPEKFKTAEEMATSYTELEKKLGTTAPPVTPPVTPPATTDLSTTAAADAALKEKGLDLNKYSDEFVSKGALTPESRAEIKSKGFTDAQIDSYVAGAVALAEKNSKDVYDSVGGQDKFNKLVEFAKTTMTPAEVAAYNDAVTKGDYASLKLILAGVGTKFDAAMGKDPKLTTGQLPGAGNGDVFGNMQEYMNAQRKPEYQKDANYRKAVDAKLERSAFWKPKV